MTSNSFLFSVCDSTYNIGNPAGINCDFYEHKHNLEDGRPFFSAVDLNPSAADFSTLVNNMVESLLGFFRVVPRYTMISLVDLGACSMIQSGEWTESSSQGVIQNCRL